MRLFVAEAATVYQEPHFWRTEGQELFAFLLDLHLNPLQRMIQSNAIPGIYEWI